MSNQNSKERRQTLQMTLTWKQKSYRTLETLEQLEGVQLNPKNIQQHKPKYHSNGGPQ